MHNDIITIGNFTIHGYGLMIALGIIAALFLADKRAKRFSLNSDYVWSIAIWAILAGILGAKLLYIITDIKNIIADPSLLGDIGNGFVFYGCIIGGVAAVYIYCRVKKLPFSSYFDLIMPSVALAQGFGRIGCFLAGCCYGKATSSPFSIVFTSSDFAPNLIPLIPTQLIMSFSDFALAAILLIIAKKNKVSGRISALYMILYSIGRFLVEFLRADPRGSVGALSTSQFISIFIFIAGAALYYFTGKKASKSQTEEAIPVDNNK